MPLTSLSLSLALFKRLHATEQELLGLNFHIADAARKTGFDTRNHVALLDLIWSVRRVAFNCGATKPRLHLHQNGQLFQIDIDQAPRERSVRKARKRAREVEAQAQGTASDPIHLNVGSSEHQHGLLVCAGPKRQKTAFGLVPDPVATNQATGPLSPIYPSRFPNSCFPTLKAEGKENIPATSTKDLPSARRLNQPHHTTTHRAPRSAH